jgi:hypothetical protein
MNHKISLDMRGFSFEEFVDFLFAHDAPTQEEVHARLIQRDRTNQSSPWFYYSNLTFELEQACSYYILLFRQPQFLLDRFSKDQLEQGFWAIQSPTLDCSVENLVWNRELSLAHREECIRSMASLFRSLFAN